VKGIGFIVGAVLLYGLINPLSADVIIKHKANSDMAGIMSMEMTGTDSYKSDRHYEETTSKMTGGMVSFMGKGKPTETVIVTRLDKNLYWNIDNEKKVYTETPFDKKKKDIDEMQKDSKDKSNEDEYTWTVDVKVIDQRQTINGFDCKGVVATATGVKKKNPADTLIMVMENWMAQNVPGTDEVTTFQKNYAKALGVDEMWTKEEMSSAMKQYGSMFSELATKMQDVGGYPIRTIMTVEAPGGPASGKEGGSNDNSMSGMMGKMGKMFGKKQSDQPEKKEETAGGRSKMFSFTNEVLSIEQKPASDSQFEIPAGYKKK
jgi:hypothetical protein